MKQKIKEEPVRVAGIIVAVFAMGASRFLPLLWPALASSGVVITSEWQVFIEAIAVGLPALVGAESARRFATSLANPKNNEGTPLVPASIGKER